MAMELKHLNPQHVMDVTGKAIDEISRLRAENAELKHKLEDAGVRERRLKRALWLARAKRAECVEHASAEVASSMPVGIADSTQAAPLKRKPEVHVP